MVREFDLAAVVGRLVDQRGLCDNVRIFVDGRGLSGVADP
jgi:hypothetical protein